MYRYLILAVALTGCASSSSTFTRPADVYNPVEYSHLYDALFAELFWRCIGADDVGMRVEGYAVSSMRNSVGLVNFEVRLRAQDSKGNILGDRSTYGDRLNASQFEPVPFQISVPAAGEGVRYSLYYSFRVPEPGARMAQPYFGTIEDLCSGRWRRRAIPPTS